MDTRLPEGKWFDDSVKFRQLLESETDRGWAFMAAGYIDDKLKDLLEKLFAEDKKVVEERENE
jgi:hypothetical protein